MDDPAKADGEESAYQYCGGNPVGSVDPAGLATRTLNVRTYLYEYVCWAPVVKSIIRYVKGATIHTLSIVKTAFGGRDPGKGNRGATVSRIKSTFGAYGLRSKVVNRPLTFSEVKSEINAGRPIYVAWQSGSSGHAVLIRGYEDASKDYIYYTDPSEGGRRKLRWDLFKKTSGYGGWPNYNWRWVRTVYKIRK